MKPFRISVLSFTLLAGLAAREKKTPPPPAVDLYVQDATMRGVSPSLASPGSLYITGTRMGDLARDPRSSQVDDLVTIVVSDQASAVAQGATNTQRKSSAKSSITAAAGAFPAASPLPNLLGATSDQQLQGQGQTSRSTTLSTTLTARVTRVLPNGYLVLEGTKEISVNSERQLVIVRGVCRSQDLSAANQIRSDRLAQLEVHVTGKGVINDAVRRPALLYRLLLGLLPF